MQCATAGESLPLDAITTLTDLISADDLKNVKEPELKQCPLCKSPIRLYFINFTEKILMCENTDCEFPFGHEDVQLFTHDVSASDKDSVTTVTCAKDPLSMGSPALSPDINKIHKAFEDIQLNTDKTSWSSKQRNQKKKENEEKLQKNLDDIKELSLELKALDPIKEKRIKNERWINNLKHLQKMSGVQLLKPEECRSLKKEEPILGLGELKIDIDPGNSNHMSSIKIEIHNNKDKFNSLPTTASSQSVQAVGKDPLPV